MPQRLVFATGFRPEADDRRKVGAHSAHSGIIPREARDEDGRKPFLTLRNTADDKLHVHPIDGNDNIVRVVYKAGMLMRKAEIAGNEAKSIRWERASTAFTLRLDQSSAERSLVLTSNKHRILIEFVEPLPSSRSAPCISWYCNHQGAGGLDSEPFLRDSRSRAYGYDSVSGDVIHYVERETWLPTSENDGTFVDIETEARLSAAKDEFVYGLGETTGRFLKGKRKYTLDPKDSLGYDPEIGDGMYKVTPLYVVYKRSQKLWYGVYYNTFSRSVFDMGSETDALLGSFRSFRASTGVLDYYVILGDGTLPSVVSAFARIVTPLYPHSQLLQPILRNGSETPSHPSPHSLDKERPAPWFASSTLPPLSQFGYLASSLGLAARFDAQSAIMEFVRTCRKKGFPIDGLHLSSGWCQDEIMGTQNVFEWNRTRYPDPRALGMVLEGADGKPFYYASGSTESTATEVDHKIPLGGVGVIANVKPWVLDLHPRRKTLPDEAFVQTSHIFKPLSPTQPGNEAKRQPEKSILWSGGFARHQQGSYVDFSARAGVEWWQGQVREALTSNCITGVWIDNNEYSGLFDDDARYKGELSFLENGSGGFRTEDDVGRRLGWQGKDVPCGVVGRATQALGMARATYEFLISNNSHSRPTIVTRSGVPGIQAYAHASWSGDNTTSWRSLRYSVAMTLSVGISFGTGLYGHDIGGFAPSNVSPSPELLVRWTQCGAWSTRFVVHSWKEVETTLWMYDGVVLDDKLEVGEVMRKVVGLRYRLAPTFYSLYVVHYHRNAWPVLKPMLWYHSADHQTLQLDTQFIFGSHILVAPVLENGARSKRVYMPTSSSDEASRGGRTWWCEIDTGIWHYAYDSEIGRWVTIDAPLNRTPVLVRGGAIVVYGGLCTNGIADGRNVREAVIFAVPSVDTSTSIDDSRNTTPIPRNGTTGTFTLIEDDGFSNDHTRHGYTEINLSFRVISQTLHCTDSATNSNQDSAGAGIPGSKDVVEVDYEIVHAGYALPYDTITFRLPEGDSRTIVPAFGKTLSRSTESREGAVMRISV